jgi:hypothetical protein
VHLNQLVDEINDIQKTLDGAEAAEAPSRRDELFREAAIHACRTYREVARDDRGLRKDLKRLRELQRGEGGDSAREEALRLLSDPNRYRQLVDAEALLLTRFGLDPAIVVDAERSLLSPETDSVSELQDSFPGADSFESLRDALCGHAEALNRQAERKAEALNWQAERKAARKKIRGGLIGLTGVLIIGGNAGLSLVTGGVALASSAAGGSLIGLGGKELL